MTETDIANLALSHLGGKSLPAGSLAVNESAQAVSARKWYDLARDETLRAHPWNFARKRALLQTSYTALSTSYTALVGVALANNGAGLVRVTATAHGLATGNRVELKGVQGVAANGQWRVTVVDVNRFDLNGSTYSGTHTSGTGSWGLTALAESATGGISVRAAAHGLSTGQRVVLKDVAGVPANGHWLVTVVDVNRFDLVDSSFSGAHVGGTGGWATAPLFGWDYWHELPADCLRVLRCNGQEGVADDGVDCELEDGRLLIDSDEVRLSYVSRHEAVDSWTPDFVTAFSLLLGSYMAQDLLGSGAGKTNELRQNFERLLLPRARGNDARESKPKTPPAFAQGSLLHGARFGGVD